MEIAAVVILFPVILLVVVFAIVLLLVTLILIPLYYLLNLLSYLCCVCCSRNRQQERLQKLVILGTGWASHGLISNLNRQDFDVTVISPRDHFVMTPLLCSAATGTVGTRAITREFFGKSFGPNCLYIRGTAIKVDFESKFVEYKKNGYDVIEKIGYDRLVISVGSTTNTGGVEGVYENACFMKEISDAQKVRRKLLRNINEALDKTSDDETRQSLRHVAIIGGGSTGTELAAELYDLSQSNSGLFFKNSRLKVSIIERSDVLKEHPRSIQRYARDLFKNRPGIQIIRSSVNRVTPAGIVLANGSELKAGLVVWTAGITQWDFTRNLQLAKNEKYQIVVTNQLSVLDDKFSHQVYALGDCAAIDGEDLPCTAQVALQQSVYLAGLLNKTSGEHFVTAAATYKPFKFDFKGSMVYLGRGNAACALRLVNRQIILKGTFASILWHAVYLIRSPTKLHRFQLLFDWITAAIFGREVTTFEVT